MENNLIPHTPEEDILTPEVRTEETVPQNLTAEGARQAALKEHFERLRRQAETLKAVYPEFDLLREMENPVFLRLTSPRVGLDVRTAYEVAHHQEFQRRLMRQGAQALAESLRSGGRPAENGVTAAPASTLPSDPRSWSPQEREDIRRRVRRGETIRL